MTGSLAGWLAGWLFGCSVAFPSDGFELCSKTSVVKFVLLYFLSPGFYSQEIVALYEFLLNLNEFLNKKEYYRELVTL